MEKWLASTSATPTPEITTVKTSTTATQKTITTITDQPSAKLKPASSSTTQARYYGGAYVSV